MILRKAEHKLNGLSKVFQVLLYSNILVAGRPYSKSQSGGQALRTSEKRKIQYGHAHFDAFENVEYKQVAIRGKLDLNPPLHIVMPEQGKRANL